jgi:hypothetical protein
MPKRIQLFRKRGWRKPEGSVSVAGTSKYHNPHRPAAGHHTVEEHAEAVRRYRDDLFAGRLPVTVDDVRRELAGKDLCCYCAPHLPCHADVLLEIANGG